MPPPRPVAMRRWGFYLLTAAAWWWLMMAVHELGNVLGCLFTGATIEAVILWPWTISETVRSGSDAPLVDTWAGPVVGAVLPTVIWLLCRRPIQLRRWVAGWAGFCWIANGIYMAAGWMESAGDAADLVHLGVPVWALPVSGSLATVAGLWLWHIQITQIRSGERRND